MEPSTEDGFHIAVLRCLGANALHVARHAGVAVEIAIDVDLRLVALDMQLAPQSPGAHPVDQPEVDRLGAAPLLAGDLVERHAEDLGGGGGVDVAALGEGIEQALSPDRCAMMRSSICE